MNLLLLSSIHKRRFHKRSTPFKKEMPGDMLCVVTQGKGILLIDNQAFHIKSGQAYMLTLGKQIEIMIDSDCIEGYILTPKHIALSNHKGVWNCASSATNPAWFQAGKLQVQLSKQTQESCHDLYERTRTCSLTAAEVQLQFQSMIHALNQELSGQDEKEESETGIDLSIGYMYKHFTHKIKLDTLSDIAGLTPTSYSRSFKKANQMSPIEYLNQIRIDASKELLQQPTPSIKDISTAVGFGSEFYFSRMFKRATGISPTMYVKRRQLKIAAASCFRFKDCLSSLGAQDAYELNSYRHLELGFEENRRQTHIQLAELRNYRPELIIADYRHISIHEQLKQIAPTVIVDFTMDWREHYLRIADLVGREKEAQQALTQLRVRVNSARKMLSDSIGEKSVSIIRLYSGKIRMQGQVDHPLSNLLYSELGLKPGSCVPLNERTKEFALDNLPAFETDYLLIDERLTSPEGTDYIPNLLKGTSRAATQAVENNRIRLIPNWISMSWAPAGQYQIIDQLLKWHGVSQNN